MKKHTSIDRIRHQNRQEWRLKFQRKQELPQAHVVTWGLGSQGKGVGCDHRSNAFLFRPILCAVIAREGRSPATQWPVLVLWKWESKWVGEGLRAKLSFHLLKCPKCHFCVQTFSLLLPLETEFAACLRTCIDELYTIAQLNSTNSFPNKKSTQNHWEILRVKLSFYF